MDKLLGNLQSAMENLPFGKKIAIFILVTVSIAGIILMGAWAKKPDLQILYSNLSVSDSAEIVTKLKQQRIPYEVTANGKTIMTASKDVYEVRMQLAGEGYPRGGGVGFEIFDKSNFGVTDFVQKLNYKRALQGELERTINNLSEIEQSRVHIVSPEKSLFIEDQKKTTTSIMLKLTGSRQLRQSQIQGIVHLVASSVEGLSTSNITLIDVHGDLLYGGQSDSALQRLSTTQLEYKQTLEKGKERRIQSMLEKFVGSRNATARVSLELDFQQEESTEESFNPNSQVARSEQRTEETSAGGGISGGIAGLGSNVPGEGGGLGGGGSNSSRTNETINYEINKTVKRIVKPVGKIEKMSISVVINGTYEGEGEEKKYVPRTPDQVNVYIDLIKNSVGFDEARGDTIKVENIEFSVPDFSKESEEMAKAAKNAMYMVYGRYASAGIIILVLILFVIKPLLKWVTQSEIQVGGLSGNIKGGTTAATTGGQEGISLTQEQQSVEMGRQESQQFRKKVHDLASTDPDRTAELVRKWMNEPK